MYCRIISCVGLSKIISTRVGVLEGNLWRIAEESGDAYSRSKCWIVSGLLHLSHSPVRVLFHDEKSLVNSNFAQK